MDSVKIFLVILVIFVCVINGGSIIDTFKPSNYPHDFNNVQIADTSNKYMCKDENDVPFSCHGQGVSQRLFDIYNDMSYGCPTNWLIPGKSIYR